MQAYNEELTSANEELQSANEELETGREEIPPFAAAAITVGSPFRTSDTLREVHLRDA